MGREFDGASVLRELESDTEKATVEDTMDLLRLAGFVEEEQQFHHRIFEHADTGEQAFVNTRYPEIPHTDGKAIAAKVKNYWP